MGRRKKIVATSDVREEVIEAMRSQSPSDRERKIVALHERYEEAKRYYKRISKETKEEYQQAEANFTAAVEEGHQEGDQDAAKAKLFRVEVSWQDLQEAKAKRKDAVGGARDGVKGTLAALEEAIKATQQIELDFDRKAEASEDAAE